MGRRKKAESEADPPVFYAGAWRTKAGVAAMQERDRRRKREQRAKASTTKA